MPIDHLFDMRSWHSSRALRLRLRTLRRRPRRRPKDSPGDGLMACHGMAHAIRWHDLSHNIVLLCIIMIYYVLSWDIHASSPSSLELSSIHPSVCWLGEPWPGCMHSSLETAFALWAPRTCGTPHGGFPLHHSTDFQHSEQWQSHSTQKDLAKHLG